MALREMREFVRQDCGHLVFGAGMDEKAIRAGFSDDAAGGGERVDRISIEDHDAQAPVLQAHCSAPVRTRRCSTYSCSSGSFTSGAWARHCAQESPPELAFLFEGHEPGRAGRRSRKVTGRGIGEQRCKEKCQQRLEPGETT
ncbi:MAG: hypothetical protein U5O39_20625 [Gammaproteobacteria bacterium]|nr:hypothetical protein [Gammaproteobacteria bacterium]